MASTRSKAQQTVQPKTETSRPPTWKKEEKETLIAAVKQEKINDSDFEPSGPFSRDEDIWEKIAKKLRAERTAARCHYHYNDMRKKKMEKIACVLNLPGMGCDEETCEVTGSEEAWDRPEVESYKRLKSSPFPYLNDMLQIEGRRKLVGKKEKDSTDEDEDDDDADDMEVDENGGPAEEQTQEQTGDEIGQAQRMDKKQTAKKGKTTSEAPGKVTTKPAKKDVQKASSTTAKTAPNTQKTKEKKKLGPAPNKKEKQSGEASDPKDSYAIHKMGNEKEGGDVLKIPKDNADTPPLAGGSTSKAKTGLPVTPKRKKRASGSPPCSPNSVRASKQPKIREAFGAAVAKREATRSISPTAEGNVVPSTEQKGKGRGQAAKTDAAQMLTPAKTSPAPRQTSADSDDNQSTYTDAREEARAPLTPQQRAISEVKTDGLLQGSGKVAMVRLFRQNGEEAEAYLDLMEDPITCRVYLEETLEGLGKDLEKCMM